MGRALRVAVCLAAAWAVGGRAEAGPRTSKVTIETDPPGAKVYFNVKEDGEKCVTPCTIDAPIGETPIIIEAENRRPIIENLVVPRKTAKPIKLTYKLEAAIGTIVVEGGAGATVKIDEEPKGTAPGRIEGVVAGAHHVVVEKNGVPLYDQFVEIEAGREATVAAGAAPATPTTGGDDRPAVVASAPGPAAPPRTTPALAVSGAMDVGFRQFTYSHNTTPETQRDNRVLGQVLAGPVIELWPTTLAGLHMLPGLALYGRYEIGLNSQAVAVVSRDGTRMPTTLSTAWRALEISVHQRWTLAELGTLEVGGGYTQDRYQFKGKSDDVAMVPDAQYKAVRIGLRASLLLGMLEPFVTVENRLVLSGGAMDGRYTLGTSTSGIHASAGGAVHVGHIEARIEGGLTRYSWTFKPDTRDPGQADGATDVIENITFAVGYTY